MATFFSIREYEDKATALETTLRTDASLRQLDVRSFTVIPGSPFAYWAPASLILLFRSMTPVHSHGREVVSTNPLNADFRFIRLWFEIGKPSPEQAWVPWAKGGSFSPYYYDVDTVILWDYRRSGFKGFMGTENRPLERPASVQHFFRPGLTWPRRTNGLSFRVMPTGCVFADKGPAIFVQGDDHKQLLALASIINSKIFYYLTSLQLSRIELAQSFEVGLIQQTPTPVLTDDQVEDLSQRARQLWFRRYTLDTKIETSHAFLLPAVLLSRVKKGGMDPIALEEDLNRLQAAVENTAFRIFGVSCQDRTAVESCGRSTRATTSANAEFDSPDKDPDELHLDADNGDAAGNEPREHEALLSWAVGVAFGRFDIHLATGERPLPSEPDPFDPLPPKSPGMLSDRDPPLHPNPGILVDDAGHQHDLPHLIDNVLDRVCMDTALDTRTWLRREFFPLHLMQYSKSRRKAPIYWPLSTASGGYTLWLYHPTLTDQTLFRAANDFVGVKLDREVEPALRALRQKTGRSREEERTLEDLQTLHDELSLLRDELLRLAPTWKPNHDDGVQITAAPLWRLFRHRPWQTVLRDTWEKLEQGDYDWAHLAMVYRPNQVREKCRTDKSLAIAHDLEHLYEPPPEAPGKTGRGRRKKG